MKKISVFLMAAVLALSICACGSTPANNGGEQTKEPASPLSSTKMENRLIATIRRFFIYSQGFAARRASEPAQKPSSLADGFTLDKNNF